MTKTVEIQGKGITVIAVIWGDPTTEEVQLVKHKLASAIAEARLEAQQS